MIYTARQDLNNSRKLHSEKEEILELRCLSRWKSFTQVDNLSIVLGEERFASIVRGLEI